MAQKSPQLWLRALVAIAVAAISGAAFARQPIAVLDALWPSFNGNSTSFVLYDDGLVIYTSNKRGSLQPYLSARLTKDELAKIFPPASLLSLKREYSTDPSTDVPSYRLLFTVGKQHSGVRVLGFLRQANDCGQCKLAPLPRALDTYLGKIIKYSNERASPWQPQSIQLEIAPEDSIRPKFQWKVGWPDVRSSAATKLNSPEGWYCLKLPGTDWPSLHELLVKMSRDDTVMIDGKGWSIVSTRFMLPNEQLWKPIGACHPDS